MILQKSLDREKQEYASLLLTAVDGGEPQRSGTMQIHITVLDVNDNAPVFTQTVYKAEIKENSVNGTVITKVSASDADKGSNGEVSYVIGNSMRGLSNVFVIMEDGHLVLNAPVDYEKAQKYEIYVEAVDRGGLSDSSKVIIDVSYSIPEEMAKGSFVGNIAQDLGLDTLRLKSGRARVFTRDNTAYIELNSERGILLLKERIDREALCGQMTPCALHFQILLENPMEFYSVTVEITDINDNPPTFITNEAHFNISESALSGTAFVLDRATDLDVGENSLKAYALKPSDIFSLKINNPGQGSKNVEMVLNAPLDREKNEHLRLVLTAVDGGEPRMTGTMQIQINVLDANDNAPVFTQPVYKAFIKENAPVGTVVGTVTATDADDGRLKSGKARIFSPDTDDYFELNNDRGVLLIKNRIDREALCGQTTPCALHFQIILENPMEFYSVTVEITDINDNPPSFEKNDVKFKISESAVRGAKFILDRAVDPDVGLNGLQTYKLEPSGNFVVKLHDQADGTNNVEMILDKPLDREKHEYLSLILTALDGGEPQMTGTMQILITVLDVNDNAPVFTQSIYEASIRENLAVGTTVMRVTATDADHGSNGRITYSISSILDNARGLFEVNGESGEIRLIGNVDYEKARTFQINIRASDDGGLVDSLGHESARVYFCLCFMTLQSSY
uniref:Protocadherin 2 gamma 28 n=1 Tax=Neolamprologus brichardi TaxID=32507 RepID=A0A3Q4GG74_NEOBR